jgi:hypothetical protein
VREFSSVLSGRDAFVAQFPATLWLANFQLSLRDKTICRHPQVKKTGTLREIQTADAAARNQVADAG